MFRRFTTVHVRCLCRGVTIHRATVLRDQKIWWQASWHWKNVSRCDLQHAEGALGVTSVLLDWASVSPDAIWSHWSKMQEEGAEIAEAPAAFNALRSGELYMIPKYIVYKTFNNFWKKKDSDILFLKPKANRCAIQMSPWSSSYAFHILSYVPWNWSDFIRLRNVNPVWWTVKVLGYRLIRFPHQKQLKCMEIQCIYYFHFLPTKIKLKKHIFLKIYCSLFLSLYFWINSFDSISVLFFFCLTGHITIYTFKWHSYIAFYPGI